MKYRRLGSTNLEVSVVGLGTWQFGGEWGKRFTQEEADAVIEEAREQGINLIDTAECYGDHLSEQMVGNAVKKDRDRWYIATKFGHLFHGYMDRTKDFSPESVIHQLEASLKALQTDYIDLYQFHSGTRNDFDNEKLWELLARQKEKGTIRHIGVSVSKGIPEEDKLYQTEKAPDNGIETIQIVYNRLERTPEQSVFPLCGTLDLGVLSRVPLASGLLSGKYKPGMRFSGQDVRADRDAEKIEQELVEVQRIARDEVPAGTDMAAWALAWCLHNEAVTTVIPGCKSPRQVRNNARAVALLEG